MAEIHDRLELAIRIAREVGDLSMRYFRSPELKIETKTDASPVTRADREGEELMRERLLNACPDDAVIGEEFDSKDGSSGYQWYLDPIDGTQSFIRGVPLFGTMMALVHDKEPILGVIVFPGIREVIYAGAGLGTWWAPAVADSIAPLDVQPAQVSDAPRLRGAVIATTGLESFFEADRIGALERIARCGASVRGWSDCYGHMLVATGRCDVMYDAAMSVWDNAPLKPIVEEAGGKFSDAFGRATIHGTSAVSTNGFLHDAFLDLLNS